MPTQTKTTYCPTCARQGRKRRGALVWRDVRLPRCGAHATTADWEAGKAEVERRRAEERRAPERGPAGEE